MLTIRYRRWQPVHALFYVATILVHPLQRQRRDVCIQKMYAQCTVQDTSSVKYATRSEFSYTNANDAGRGCLKRSYDWFRGRRARGLPALYRSARDERGASVSIRVTNHSHSRWIDTHCWGSNVRCLTQVYESRRIAGRPGRRGSHATVRPAHVRQPSSERNKPIVVLRLTRHSFRDDDRLSDRKTSPETHSSAITAAQDLVELTVQPRICYYPWTRRNGGLYSTRCVFVW